MKKINKIINYITSVMFGWLLTCFLVWFIAICFDVPFTMNIGTGVWLITVLLRFTFNVKK